MSNERLGEVLNASNSLQISPLQKLDHSSVETSETNQAQVTPANSPIEQASSIAQLPAQEIAHNQLPISPPPYHQYAINGEAIVMTSLPGETPILSPLDRTPPPPYNPQHLLYVYPKNNLRRNPSRTKINRWVYIIIATCAGSLLLGIMKFIIVLQSSVYHKSYHH